METTPDTQTAPDGWFAYGTHADAVAFPMPEDSFLIFSDEVSEDGLPLWERVVPTDDTEGLLLVITRLQKMAYDLMTENGHLRNSNDLLVSEDAEITSENLLLRATLGKILELCAPRGYTTWDRAKKLGEPPWDQESAAVKEWEEVHGHHVGLKCYPEYGCQLLVDPSDIFDIIEEAKRATATTPEVLEGEVTE